MSSVSLVVSLPFQLQFCWKCQSSLDGPTAFGARVLRFSVLFLLLFHSWSVRIHECACGVSMPALAATVADTVTQPLRPLCLPAVRWLNGR